MPLSQRVMRSPGPNSFSNTRIPGQFCIRSYRCSVLLRFLTLVLMSTIFADSLAYAAPIPLAAATAKQKVTAKGVGKDVKLIRADGSEIKGKIVSIGDDAVVVQPKKAPTPDTVKFADITAVKGPGLSKGAKIGIAVGIGAALVVGIIVIVAYHNLFKPIDYKLPNL